MNLIYNFPLFTIVLSLFSGVLCTMLGGKTARRYTIIYECVLIALVSCVLYETVRTGTAFTYVMGEFPAPWGYEIRAGVLEALLGLVFLIVMLCSVLGGARFVDIDLDETALDGNIHIPLQIPSGGDEADLVRILLHRADQVVPDGAAKYYLAGSPDQKKGQSHHQDHHQGKPKTNF